MSADIIARGIARQALPAALFDATLRLRNFLVDKSPEFSFLASATETPTITLAATTSALSADWPASTGSAAITARFKFRCMFPTPRTGATSYIQSRGPLTGISANRSTVKGVIEFTTDAPVFELIQYGLSSSGYAVFVDGKLVGSTVASKPNDAAKYYDRYDYSAAAKPRRMRKIQIYGDKSYNFYGIRTGSTGDTVIPTPRVPSCLVIGDSYTDGGSGTLYNYYNWGETMCRALGWDFYSSGVGGTGYVNNNGGLARNFAERYPSDMPPGIYDVIVLALGINDIPNEIYPTNAWTQAQLNTAQQSAITSVLADNPNATVIVFGPWRGSSGNAGSYTTPAMDTAMAGIVSGFTSEYRRRLFYVPTINDPEGAWMDGDLSTGRFPIYGNTGDGTHYTDPGYEYLGLRASQGVRKALACP